MSLFTETLTKAQQFMLIQAYADKILTETELMSFILMEAKTGQPIMITETDTYQVTPDLDFDNFSAVKTANSQWQLLAIKAVADTFEVTIKSETDEIVFSFSSLADAQGFGQDLKAIYKAAADYVD
ncbi:hypothetical protein [Enterococcus sp. HY326]|uniref:hypothetical protein n=1 Tax=Enterococcus sp. HY326 TaxID=2971265 RepID=UPI002240ACB1|nr:hypothetical protein [Enterococcus sp. HY326]